MTQNQTINSTKTTILYTLLQFIYWAMNCSIYSFAAMFFLFNHFQNKDIGLLLAVANIVSVFLQPYISQVIIHTFNLSLKKTIFGINFILCCTLLTLIFLTSHPIILTILYCISVILILTLQPFINALGFEYINHQIPINFGLSRGAGSLAFALTSYLVGILLGTYTPNALPILVLTISVCLFIPLILLKNIAQTMTKETQKSKISFQSLFTDYPFLSYLLIGFALLFVFHTIISTFMTQIITSVGGNSKNVGVALMIAGFCELPAMIFFSKLIKLKDSRFWVVVSSLFFFLRSLAIIFASSVVGVQSTQFLQAVSFALFIPASAYLFNQYMNKTDSVVGQTLLTAAITTGGVIGNILGGFFLDYLGMTMLLIISSAIACLGSLLTFQGVRKIKEHESLV